VIAALAIVIALYFVLGGRVAGTNEFAQPVRYVGAQACAQCHAKQHAAWRGSQHAQAMQHATADTVLGRFDNARITYGGVTSTFFRRDNRFYVNTDGPDGRLTDFEIRYTFGVAPLQQYLIAFPDGRMQALSIAWDTRPKQQGGQRWFHLYPNEKIDHRDPLHWTRRDQNWNWMCADCHSTDLRRHYNASDNTYKTTWSEINVACEACHGPGSDHVAWARLPGEARSNPSNGLVVQLDERKGIVWHFKNGSSHAARSSPISARAEVDTCAQCHARRASLADGFTPGAGLMDTHDPSLLSLGLYFADGQQQDEVYTYGSFLQSKMYAKGVTCSDCHEPHSGKLRAPGNAVCAQCHASGKYDAPAHTLHRDGSAGASCAACHMPTRNYMVIDPRHDHSLRIPRPDLSARLGTPNACNSCHRDKDARWAAGVIERAFGPQRKGHQRFALALHAGRTGEPGAAAGLIALAHDSEAPAIARATALEDLSAYPGPAALSALERGLADADPLVRGAALDTLLTAPPAERMRLALKLIEDPVRVVRIKAARALAIAPLEQLPTEQRARLEQGYQAYIASQRANAERPEAHLNLGVFYTERRLFAEAEAEYRAAMRLDSGFAAAYLNLADLFRGLARDADAETVLVEGLKNTSGDGDLTYALALLRVRQGRPAEALPLLAAAVAKRPGNARYAFVHAVALHDLGRQRESLAALRAALKRFPYDQELLNAAATFAREAGDHAAATDYARRLIAVTASPP
jgi:predicted CXXCH cytochrome family protein